MTARAELLPNRILAAALFAAALVVGVLAGYSPPVAVGLVLAIVFVVVALGNLAAGVVHLRRAVVPGHGAPGPGRAVGAQAAGSDADAVLAGAW